MMDSTSSSDDDLSSHPSPDERRGIWYIPFYNVEKEVTSYMRWSSTTASSGHKYFVRGSRVPDTGVLLTKTSVWQSFYSRLLYTIEYSTVNRSAIAAELWEIVAVFSQALLWLHIWCHIFTCYSSFVVHVLPFLDPWLHPWNTVLYHLLCSQEQWKRMGLIE